MNISFVIMEVNYGSIDCDYSSCHDYYFIKFSSHPYTLQGDLSTDVQVISSVEMLCQRTFLFRININSHSYV